MRPDPDIPSAELFDRLEKIGLENDDFTIPMTIKHAKLIIKMHRLQGKFREIQEYLAGIMKDMPNVIDIIWVYKYPEYLKHYPDHEEMKREKENHDKRMEEFENEVNKVEEKLEKFTDVIWELCHSE